MKRLAILIGFMTVCSSGWATNGYVQSVMCHGASGAANCAMNANVVAGNTLIAFCVGGSNGSAIALSTDTKGDIFTKVYASDLQTAGSKHTNVAYVLSAVGGATTITCSEPSNDAIDAIMTEYGSTVTAGGFDISTSSSPAVNTLLPLTSGSGTTTASNDLVFGFCRDFSGTLSAPNGTQRQNTSFNYLEATQDAIVASPSSYASTWTSSVGNFWTCGEVAFKPTAATPSGGSSQMMKYERYE
jgi:hypothetical protein